MQHLTDAHKSFIRANISNGDALIAMLEREAASPQGADLSKFMAGMYLMAGMNATLPTNPPATPDEPQET